MRNRHPADQPAEVRRDLEDLKAKEKFLRALLLETRDFQGEEWRAHPQELSQQRLDSVAAKQRYGELLEPFQVTQTYTVLKLVRVIGTAAKWLSPYPPRRREPRRLACRDLTAPLDARDQTRPREN